MITTLTGDNHFLLQQELKGLTAKFVEQYSDIALEKYDGDELDPSQLESTVSSLPFLVERRMVVVRNGSNNKVLAEKIEKVLERVADTTDLLLVEDKPDKRSSYYKTLKKQTELKEFSNLDRNNLPKWLSDQAREKGGELSQNDARYLVERVGDNQMMLANELEKLLSYQPQITRQTIELLTELTPQSTIFELVDSAFAGNTKKALALYDDQRKQKVEPLQILAMIGWQLHIMAIVKTGGQRSSDEIAREAKLNPFVVRKTLNLTRKLSLADIKDLINRTLNLEIQLKSQSIDADEALQHLLLTLAR